MLHRLSRNQKRLLPFFRYLCVGGTVFVIDIGAFQLLLLLHIYRPVAATIAYALAVCTHFIVNKFFTFRSFDRSTLQQLKTYLVVVGFGWIVSLLVIEISVRGLGFSPLLAKLIAVAVNIPVGFLSHRYLTFGPGIAATLRRYRHSNSKR